MTPEQWNQLNEGRLHEMLSTLHLIHDSLRGEDGQQVYKFLKPIKHLIDECAFDAVKFKNLRLDQGDDIINGALNSNK